MIIPAYNESENIVATLENVTRAFEPLGLPHEILVIDDGSRDATAELVASNLDRFPHVRLLKNERLGLPAVENSLEVRVVPHPGNTAFILGYGRLVQSMFRP